MKNAYVFLLIFAALQVCGQTEKGNSFLTANLSTRFESTLQSGEYIGKWRAFSLESGLSYGKFIKDNILWEVNVSERFNSSLSESLRADYRSRGGMTDLGVGTSGSYYFGKDRWRGFVGAGLTISTGFNNSETEIDRALVSSYNSSSINIAPLFKAGAVYFFDKHWAIQLATGSNSFPIEIYGVSTGLLYWIQPTSYRAEETKLSTLQKGRWMLGTNVGFRTLQTDNGGSSPSYPKSNNEKTFEIGLSVGRFVSNRTLIGVRANFGSFTNKVEYSNPEKSTQKRETITGSLFVKRYLASSRFTPYWETSLDYIRTNINRQTNAYTSSSHDNVYQVRSSFGLAYIISNHFLVETQLASIGFQYQEPDKMWGVDLSGKLSPSFTLSYVF
ncbi:hypothetical protein [Runella limosa]|uniref:hypothetical protein n=1 Tax=Runella limosa TaxID=370978 RepID=UPI0004203421|nr:hypothetical protein [Runella limosa]